MTYYVSSVLFFFNDTSTTEIYTYYTLFPYATLFRSHAADLLGRGEARVMASDSEPMPAAASEAFDKAIALDAKDRSEEHTSELQSLMRISYAVFCLKKKIKHG